MKTKFSKSVILGGALVAALIAPVQAVQVWDVLPYGGVEDTPHIIWFSGGRTYSTNSTLTLTEFDDATAKLSGRVYRDGDLTRWLDVDIDFIGKVADFPATASFPAPKNETGASAADILSWEFYTSFSGTFTKQNSKVIAVEQRGPAFSIGSNGANNKNDLFGGAAWFTATKIRNGVEYEKVGDFNFSLTARTTVPDGGASLALLGLACGSLGLLRRFLNLG